MILLTSNNVITWIGAIIECGQYEADPSRELFKLTDENGVVTYAAPDGFQQHEVSYIPEGVHIGTWCYTESDGFVKLPEPEPEPEPIPEPEPEPTIEDRLTALEQENNLLRAQIQAASDQNEFLEDCIAEMAGVVYA